MGYFDIWVFVVDGLIGVSFEILVMVQQGIVMVWVFVGMIGCGVDVDVDIEVFMYFVFSIKDFDEYQYVVQSVFVLLCVYIRVFVVSEQLFLLKLLNLFYFVIDVEGELVDGEFVFDLVCVLYFMVVVVGIFMLVVIVVICDFELFDCGCYVGLVGWVDVEGNGEWVIVLWCVQFVVEVDVIGVIVYVGVGIVVGFDLESELLEMCVKFCFFVDVFV